MATGLCNCIDLLRHRHAISQYYIKSFTNLTDRHRRAFIVGAMASYLADALLNDALADNRLPLLLPTLDGEIQMETEWLLSVPDLHWTFLAGLCNSDMVSLRAETIDVMLTSAGFIRWRLRDARQLPWSLVGGDVQDKLQQLKSGAKPMDRVGGKIWELMQLGIYDGVCLAGVRLLQ